jgi:hypothetical protein
MGLNLTGQLISATYEDLVQISGSILTDGLGNNINNLTVTASLATNALSASFAASSSFATTASFAQNAISVPEALFTASVSLNTITFTKGNATTFPITVNTFPFTGSAIITGSLGVTGSIGVQSGSFNGTVIDNLTTPTASDAVEHVVALSADDYSAILVPDPNTLYIINDTTGSLILGNTVVSGSLTVTGTLNAPGLTVASASFATSASFAQNALSASFAPDTTFPFTGSAQISGSLGVTGSIILSDPSQTFLRGNNDFNIGNATATQAVRIVGSDIIFSNNNSRFDSPNFEVNSSNIRLGDSPSDNIIISGSIKTNLSSSTTANAVYYDSSSGLITFGPTGSGGGGSAPFNAMTNFYSLIGDRSVVTQTLDANAGGIFNLHISASGLHKIDLSTIGTGVSASVNLYFYPDSFSTGSQAAVYWTMNTGSGNGLITRTIVSSSAGTYYSGGTAIGGTSFTTGKNATLTNSNIGIGAQNNPHIFTVMTDGTRVFGNAGLPSPTNNYGFSGNQGTPLT